MILLTGASGFLGKAMTERLDNLHLDYITVGRSTMNTVKWDLGTKCTSVLAGDTVVHAAGKAHMIPKNAEDKADFYAVNVQGTRHLLEALENNDSLKKFVFISSVAVYGLIEGIDIAEDALLLATDPYGNSKIEAEKMIAGWCTKKNIEYYILRLPLIAGKRAPGNLGAMVSGIRSGRYLSIGKADSKKSMILANDLANFITNIQGLSGVYNLTDGYHPSFKELEHTIATFYKKNEPVALPLIVAKLLGFAGDLIGSKFPLNSNKLKKITSTLTFNDSKARNLLGWQSHEVLKHWEVE
ncbi:MAG: galE 3 [Ferruginibacter sp.]|nr:galE 3 [Ferruginibacter sp.]